MKTIGLIGGMSWESSIEYYRLINEAVRDRFGGLHSAKSILFSVNFADMATLQHEDRWPEAAEILIEAAQKLQMAGASMVLLCTNTMHKLSDEIESRISIPFLHIADATAARVKEQGLRRVGLLGTKFTMEQDFYRHRLTDRHGLEVLIPDTEDRNEIHRIIYDEICAGHFKLESQQRILAAVKTLARDGAEGVLLGCTELELLVNKAQADVPLFETTRIHAETAVAEVLRDAL